MFTKMFGKFRLLGAFKGPFSSQARQFKQSIRDFSNVPNFKGKPLQAETAEIRDTLSNSVDSKGITGSLLSTLFNVRPIKSNLFDFRKYLSEDQAHYVKLLDDHSYQLILDEHLQILQKFYKAKQQEHSALGKLYRSITFEEMICRFIKARYEAAYQDGRLLCFRNEHQELSQQVQHLSDRDKLILVGTPEDKGKLYEHYLTLEESALSHLVTPNGYFLPIETGARYKNNGILPNYRTGNTRQELEKAHLGPVFINYAVGPEIRDGRTLHYDALMCVERADEKPGNLHYDRRVKALKHKGFGSVAQDLYGDEYPQGPKPKEDCKILQFKLPVGKLGSENAYFYVNAYKTRLRHTLKQTLVETDMLMPEPGTIRLKGLGLGAFGISSLENELETIYLEVLDELLNTLSLKNINKVELINFPSLMNRFENHPGDLDFIMGENTENSFPVRIVKHPQIKIVQKLTPCLSDADGAFLSTQVCGDSISRPGNEGAVGLPPQSSDEASMYYSLAGMQAMREQTNAPNSELSGKIMVTDGERFRKLDGTDIDLDLSALKSGKFKDTTTLKTENLSLIKAIKVMDHLNAVRGVAASLKPEDKGCSVVMTIHPKYDRDRFFGVLEADKILETESSEPILVMRSKP